MWRLRRCSSYLAYCVCSSFLVVVSNMSPLRIVRVALFSPARSLTSLNAPTVNKMQANVVMVNEKHMLSIAWIWSIG